MSRCLLQTVPMLTPPGERLLAQSSLDKIPPLIEQQLRQFVEQTEFPACCYHAGTGVVVWQSAADFLPFCPSARRLRLGDVSEIEITVYQDGLSHYLIPLPDAQNSPGYVLSGYCLTEPEARPRDIILQATAEQWSADRLEKMLANLPVCPERMLGKILQLAVEQFQQARQIAHWQQSAESATRRLELHAAETSLLNELVQKLHQTRSPDELAVLCVRRLHAFIQAAGHAICLQSSEEEVQFLVEGRLPFNEAALARLLSRFDQHDWSQPLIRNQVRQSLLGNDFPGLQNLIVVPIGEGASRRGWILCVNSPAGSEFTLEDGKILASMATILSTQVRNHEFFNQHDELLLSFVRSLVSTLDAKDPYTRGHSERVALIARKLGEQLQLPESDLEAIYLSGLLHDLGKVGIDDRVLRKPDQLTEEEFQHIQQHPLIGYQILSQLKSLQQILPGVRSHHESINGRGYPDRLRGEEIPLMARIIAVADAYDAMCSNRPYRQGMPVEKLEEIFHKGSGEQWDSRVIEAYFAVRDDILQLCNDYSPATGNLLMDRVVPRVSGITVRTFLRH